MKLASTLIIAALCAIGAASGASADSYSCGTNARKCPFPPPPVPPVPPAPPAPPVPPAPPMAALPALPALPAAPMAMAIPDAPKAAHAACAGKKTGSSMSFVYGKGKTMAGRCILEGGKMVFDVEAYHSED